MAHRPAVAPATFVDSLVGALAALHGIAPDAAAETGVRVLQPTEARQSLAQKMEKTRRWLEVPEALWRRWQTWLGDDTYWPEHAALVHGDLQPGHRLVDQDHQVTGLLDWTEAGVTGPATDFALYYATVGGSALSSLLRRYQDAGDRVWPRMHEHIVERCFAYPVTIVMFTLRTGEDAHRGLTQMALAAHAQQMADSR